ncbi:glycosyltransferase family 2 protein [Methanocella arvoryzae]|uniref:Glycosyltransferase (Family 2) n=1 Tax=Methanocella arvoryzae (strain DSM 22066 / NBRC 105507 / MRE50) TaxID=351160 RepID=Q0W3F1_METAR|nr:glycosyltransferase family 2 protein [Methanocella arvoryzae]CAJ37092.1 putative glycosyltransferase (family 2) [Methanocella arvoryzae MRE50]
MSTLFHERTTALSAVPSPGVLSGSVVLIHGRLNPLVLGTIVAVARGCADSVIVVPERHDARLEQLAGSLGARVVPADPDGASILGSVLAEAGTVVAMYGDGSHDPFRIPALLRQASGGSDVVAGAPLQSSGSRDAARLLNNHKRTMPESQFIAASHRALEGIGIRPGTDLSQQIQDHARRCGIKVRNVDPAPDYSYLGMARIGVVVPAYNEEVLLGETVRGMPSYVSRIYVIDDCSTDRTPEVLRKLADEDPRVVGLRHEVNKGVGATIIDGYKLALQDRMDYVAVMAGDNQMDPEELPRLLLPVMEGKADYAKGNRLLGRQMRKGMSSWRFLGNSMLTMLNKIASGYWHISDPQNGYTVISREALETLDLDSIYTYYGYCNDLLVKLNAAGFRTIDVPIPARYGREKSKIRYGRFIFKVAPMLFRGFLWRLRVKYTVLDFHPLVLFYLAGMALLPAGILTGLLSLALPWLNPPAFAPVGLFATILALAGLQSLLAAMAMDAQIDRESVKSINN